ncbi:MAG TPA: hypothetical protein VF624_10730 [Tepidisphaeraceae bacterium]|jgi:hypothetical protein
MKNKANTFTACCLLAIPLACDQSSPGTANPPVDARQAFMDFVAAAKGGDKAKAGSLLFKMDTGERPDGWERVMAEIDAGAFAGLQTQVLNERVIDDCAALVTQHTTAQKPTKYEAAYAVRVDGQWRLLLNWSDLPKARNLSAAQQGRLQELQKWYSTDVKRLRQPGGPVPTTGTVPTSAPAIDNRP